MPQDSETLLKTALALTPGVNAALVNRCLDRDVSLEDFFHLEDRDLAEALGMRPGRKISYDSRREALVRAREELEFMHRHGIRVSCITDEDYPARMQAVEDAPVCIFRLGERMTDPHPISIVGTRTPTPYGTTFCNSVVEELKAYFPDILIVSGLAYGIDAEAHRSALRHKAATVAVLAHGLDMIYPAANRGLAKSILDAGGELISEYPSQTRPYRRNFLERNRIVAAISDVTLVVESALKGGALSTANLAFGYNREVAALPGRISDTMSQGCNRLIATQKATLVQSALDIMQQAGWERTDFKIDARQRILFPEMDEAHKPVYDLLRTSSDIMSLDEIQAALNTPVSKLMAILGDLEFDGVIIRYPGNRYTLA